jgi:hypothetical protein
MDIRDLEFWMKEAQVNALRNRMEAFVVSLLPHQKQDFVRNKIEETRHQIMAIEKEDEIEEIEKMSKKHLETVRKRLDEMREERKRKAQENK